MVNFPFCPINEQTNEFHFPLLKKKLEQLKTFISS